MLLKELVGKEVVDLQGRKLGIVKEADVILEISSGKVESIIIKNNKNKYLITWYGVKHIGSKVILIDNALKYMI